MVAASHPLPWPAPLDGSPAIVVIERALSRGRLSHSLLVTGDDPDLLRDTALALADRLLNPPGLNPALRRPLARGPHPDCFHLRPAGKSRQIGADATRDLITQVQVSASAGGQKVALLHECDRMNVQAANVFLKTLEEPPAHTTLLLLTTRPHSLLPTIRSRCQLFRFSSPGNAAEVDGWPAWLEDYRAWLGLLHAGAARSDPAGAIFRLYGLVARFGALLENAVDSLWAVQKKSLPADLTSEQQEAIESGLSKGLRDRLFADLERATGLHVRTLLGASEAPAAGRAYADTIHHLEHAAGLLRVNFSDTAALELFLLNALRAWTRK